jgi:hypothetical protein
MARIEAVSASSMNPKLGGGIASKLVKARFAFNWLNLRLQSESAFPRAYRPFIGLISKGN